MTYTNHYRTTILAIISLGFITPAVAMDQNHEEHKNQRLAEFIRNIGIGSLTGITEVTVNQPLICIKNRLQQNMGISLDPRILYRGFGVQVACMAPTTAVQISVNKALEEKFARSDAVSTTLRAFAAGAISALASSPTELIVLTQQNEGKNAYKTIKGLTSQEGLKVLSRGFVAKSLRDGGFGVGFLSMYPWLNNKIRNSVIDNEPLALIGAGIIGGSATAIATHPFDTISTRMQADYKKEKIKSMREAIKMIYITEGAPAFFKGVTPRGIRVALAIPLMHTVKEYLTGLTDTNAQ